MNGGLIPESNQKTGEAPQKPITSIQDKMKKASMEIAGQIAESYGRELRLQFKILKEERDRFVSMGKDLQAKSDEIRSALLPKITELKKIHEQAKSALKTIQGV